MFSNNTCKASTSARPTRRRLRLAGLALVVTVSLFAACAAPVNAPSDDDSSSLDRLEALADVAERAAPSVGLVLVHRAYSDGTFEEFPAATAWVVGEGLLGTAAHVAEIIEELDPEDQLLVRFPGPNARTVKVESAVIHPLYGRLGQLLAEAGSTLGDEGWVPAADVALLRVDPADASRLPEPLRLASDDRLARLRRLAPLVLVGHPLEGLVASGSDPTAPIPGAFIGTISRISDHLFAPAPVSETRLLHVDIPATGGASGSPVLDADGFVVGILTAGNLAFVQGQRVPLAVGLNFVQRIDWLHELLEQPLHRLDAQERSWRDRVRAAR